MPRLRREPPAAGAPRSGRSHAFLGGRDRDFVLAGLTLEHSVVRAAEGDLAGAGTLTVTLTNLFAGHNLPTDSRNCALDLVVTVRDALGVEQPAIEGLGDRHPGGETGTARLRFRNPYRSSGNTSTQIPAGEARQLAVPFSSSAVSATIDLFYKVEPWIPDSGAHWTRRLEVDLTAR
jgi:hypothetical protein